MGGLTKVTGFWEGLTGPARRLLVGAVLIFAVGVFVLMRFAGATSYATLTTASKCWADRPFSARSRHVSSLS